MSTAHLCLFSVSRGVCRMYLCKVFHVFCEQFWALRSVV